MLARAMDRSTLLQPLGLRRNLLLDCLGANTPQAPGWFDIPPGIDIFAAYSAHITELSRHESWQDDRDTKLLLAAARFLTGEFAGATLIAANLPEYGWAQRFGQRYCPLMPYRTLSAALPLPDGLRPPESWLAGTPQQAALQQWLGEHRDMLRWQETEAIYTLP